MVIIILLMTLVLRLAGLNQSLWLDEAVQAITSAGPFNGLWMELIGDFHPPLYHLFMWVWVHLLGNSEIVLRLPSVLFGVGTVYLGFKIATLIFQSSTVHRTPDTVHRSLISNIQYLISPPFQRPPDTVHWPLITVILLATSPYLIYYSQEARMYSASAFLATLSSYLFIRLLKNQESVSSKFKVKSEKLWFKVKSYIPFLFVNAALVYTDYYGWLVVLAQGIYFVIHTRRIKLGLFSVILFLVSYLPWLNMLITQMKAGLQATQALPVWASLVNLSALKAIPLTFVKYSIGRISFPDKLLYLFVVIFVTGVYILLGVLGSLGFLKKLNKKTLGLDAFRYLSLWFIVPLTIAWLVSFGIPNFQPFRLLLILPAFHLLTAYLISNITTIRLQWLLFILVISLNLGGYLYYQLTPSMKREDWRGLVKYTDINRATLLIPSESSNWPVRYYTNRGTQLVYGATGAEQVIQPPVLGGNTIYYLRYLVPVFDPGENILNQLQALGYNKANVSSFNQLEIWEYQKKIEIQNFNNK